MASTLSSEDLDSLQSRITAAFESALNSHYEKTKDTSSASPKVESSPPKDDSAKPSSDVEREVTLLSESSNKIAKDSESTLNSVAKTTNMVTGIMGAGFQTFQKSVSIAQTAISGMAEEFDSARPEIARFRETIGGISIDAITGKEELNGLARVALDGYEKMIRAATAVDDSMTSVKIQGDYLKGQNPLLALYGDGELAAKAFEQTLTDFVDNNKMPSLLQKMTHEQIEQVTSIRDAMKMSGEETADLFKRQYAYTQDTSTKIFEEIANVSVSLSKKTGLAQSALQKDVITIMTDLERFGDIGVDSAGRIAASIQQLGLDFQTFASMTDNFMNFDSAAQKMGELSALFGIQMDAMEMTYLANEDQEEFLLRMREEVLDAGIDVDNMSNARSKLLAKQLGMGIDQMKMFMRTGEQMTTQDALIEATDQAETMDGMTTAMRDIANLESKAAENAKYFNKNLELQLLYAKGVREEVGRAQEIMQKTVNTVGNIQIPESAKENFVNANAKFIRDGLTTIQNDVINPVVSGMEEAFKGASDFVTDITKDTMVSHTIVEFEKSTVGELKAEVEKSREISNDQKNEIKKLVDSNSTAMSQMSGQIEVLVKKVSDKDVKITLELDGNVIAEKTVKAMAEN